MNNSHNSQKSHLLNTDSHSSQSTHQQSFEFIQSKQDFFAFFKKEEKPSNSFFSKEDLGKDILKVTGAELDICLMVFYALYHVLWPQIENQPDIFFKHAWRKFIGDSIIKGMLCPPEKLIAEREVEDIKTALSHTQGEKKFFEDLDQVVDSISDLKEKIREYASQIFHEEEIMASLTLIQ